MPGRSLDAITDSGRRKAYLIFSRAMPLSTYEDYESAIHRIGNGEVNVLTTEPVQLLEPTSGTNGARSLFRTPRQACAAQIPAGRCRVDA